MSSFFHRQSDPSEAKKRGAAAATTSGGTTTPIFDRMLPSDESGDNAPESWVELAPSRASLCSSVEAAMMDDANGSSNGVLTGGDLSVNKDSRLSPVSMQSPHADFEPTLEQVKYRLTKDVLPKSTDWIWDWSSRPEAFPPPSQSPNWILMKELDDKECDADDVDDCMDSGVQLDPSSISLFSSSSAPQTAAAPKSGGATISENYFKFSKSNAKSESAQGGSGSSTSAVNNRRHLDNNDRKRQTLSNYASGKATEVAKRRNLNERIEKLKTSHGIIFNVPQCEEITLNQLAIFLRRLRKSHDVQSIMSADMMAKVFQEEKPAEPPALKNGGVTAANPTPLLLQALQQANNHSSNHPAVISVNDLLGSDDDMAHQQKEDEANITESSSDDDDADAFGRQYYATDNERPTTSGGDGEDTEWDDLDEEMQFYKKRMEIISADMRAVTVTKNIAEAQRKARLALSSVLDEVKFEALPQTGNLEEDSQSCARCRAFVERPDRPLCFVNFAERRNRPQSVISQNLRCTVADYAKVDDSIHPFLSLSSAIPMERKVHKYLQVASTLPPEVERRRLKTAELAYRRNHKVCRTFHYTDHMPDLEENTTDSPPPISLTIKKKLTRLVREQRDEAEDYSPSNTTVDDDDDEATMASSDDDDDGTEDSDYPPMPVTQRRRRRKDSSMTRKSGGGHLSNKENSPTSKEHASQQSTLLSKTVKKKSELLPTSSRNGQRKKIVDAVKVTAETKRPQRSGCANSRNNGSGRTTAVLRCAQKQVNSTNRSQRRIDSRRSSLHSSSMANEYGSSIFDYDSSFTDIGLTAVQNVDPPEIVIPGFRIKDVLERNVAKPCKHCPASNEEIFARNRQLHETLELQEKQRFKQVLGPARTRY